MLKEQSKTVSLHQLADQADCYGVVYPGVDSYNTFTKEWLSGICKCCCRSTGML